MFFDTLIHNIDKKKLKLKHYPLGKVSQTEPDYRPFESINDASNSLEETPILQLKFSLTKEELITVNFKLYYTSPSGLIMTAIGILFIISYITTLLSNGSSPFIRLMIEFIITILVPVMIYFRTVKSFEKDASLQREYIHSFYNDYYIIQGERTEHKIFWSDVVKVKELKTAFLLFETKYIAHVLPKRVVKEDEVKMNILRDLINNTKSHL